MRSRPLSLPALAVLVLGAALAACGPPPEAAPTPDAPLPAPQTPAAPTTAPPAFPVPGSPPPVDPDDAVDCAGEPDESRIVTVLQEADLVSSELGELSVTEGPLCAEDWQFAVITVPDRDPLQVITRGAPEELELVTAGTDVCTVEVRVHAPPGIRRTAGCVG